MQIFIALYIFIFRPQSTAKPKPDSILDPSCKPKNMSATTMTAFRECFVQMRNSISPLDKLAHLLTALKVIVNSVSINKLRIWEDTMYCKNQETTFEGLRFQSRFFIVGVNS